MLTRRRVLRSLASFAALASVGCARPTTEPEAPKQPAKPEGPQRILMLGGTGFLGPQFVRAALAHGHTVTLFNRGKTNPHLFPELEKLRGDRRAGDLKALEGREFDSIIDTSGYVPDEVTAVAKILATSGHYLFISSVSAYRDQGKPGLRESDPVAEHPEPGNHDVMKFYGPLKAQCEAAAEAAMPGKTTVIRPGLIVGPDDPTDRFTYWPVRIARGGEVMAPGKPTDPVQVIDARDLAAFMLECVEQRHNNIYNAVGPAQTLTVEAMLKSGIEAIQSDARLTWVPAEFLEKHQVQPWMEMTVWVPPDSEFGGLGAVDNSAAVADGLTFRPLGETMVDTLAWWNEQPEERRAKPRAGLAPEREVEVLAAWQQEGAALATG
jgi:2'-hydroxyisoflavone reductase